MKQIKSLSVMLFCFLFSSGGGGSSGPVTSTLSFPLKSAYQSLVASGFSKNLSFSGSCSGIGTFSVAAANTPATFETVSGFSSVATMTTSFTNCTNFASSITYYYDSNYVELGYTSTTDYDVFTSPLSIPTSVMVGDTGILGTETLYTNSSKTTTTGTRQNSYIVQPDTADSAIVVLISNHYDTSPVLISSEQDSYRITSLGALVPLKFDYQEYSPAFHLVATLH